MVTHPYILVTTFKAPVLGFRVRAKSRTFL